MTEASHLDLLYTTYKEGFRLHLKGVDELAPEVFAWDLVDVVEWLHQVLVIGDACCQRAGGVIGSG